VPEDVAGARPTGREAQEAREPARAAGIDRHGRIGSGLGRAHRDELGANVEDDVTPVEGERLADSEAEVTHQGM